MPDEAIPTVGGHEPTPSPFAGRVPITVALEQLRLRLLDLTGRNRLIHFRHTAGKSLQFVHTNIDAVLRRLLGDHGNNVTIAAVPEPGRADWVTRGGRLVRPDVKDHAAKVGIDTSYELYRREGRALVGPNTVSQARTLFFADDLGRHCRKLEREAKLAIEETGANMLYLVLGFLEFPESPDSEKLYRAPLLCVPVAMTRSDEGQYSTFCLNYTGEELADNLSLREKVKRDFNLNLPEFGADEDTSAEAYFEAVTDATATLPNWQVKRMMTLTLLSFTNMLLVRDLDPENWPQQAGKSSLLTHPVVKQVFEGRPSTDGAQYATEYTIDDHPGKDLPLIYDADSSQHSALIDVMKGLNRVIEGPPGTGKSQTITNLVAAALQAGKKVLFVAEKLAALQVVKSRLTQAGLDPFVLELHSNKTTKKRVLDDLAARVSLRLPNARDLPELLERQEQKRKELKAYADLMNSPVSGRLELTLHAVLWRAELNRMRCGPFAAAVQGLDYIGASRVTPAKLAALRDRLRYLAGQFGPIGAYGPSHPLWGFFPTELKPEDDQPIQQLLDEYAREFAAFAQAVSELAQCLGGTDLNLGAKGAEHLLGLLAELQPAEATDVAYALLPTLFPASDPQGSKSLATLHDLRAKAGRIAELEAHVQRCLLEAQPCSQELVSKAREVLAALKACGLQGADAQQLATRRQTLQQGVNLTDAALGDLRQVTDSAGLPLDMTTTGVQRLVAVLKCAAAAPTQVLHLRHAGLRLTDAIQTLKRASEQRDAQQRQLTELDERFYMDAVPEDGELSTAISTLREGPAWYRIFQGRWHSAIGMHRRLEKTKSKKPAAQRLLELETLRQHRRERESWDADSALLAVAGPHFKSTQTPLEELQACAQWVAESDAALEQAGLGRNAFDVLQADRPTLQRLAGLAALAESSSQTLAAFDATCRQALAAAQTEQAKVLQSTDWTKRIAAVELAVGAAAAAEALLASHARPGMTAEQALLALAQSHEVPLLEEQLAAHEGGRNLFGRVFRGRHTPLQPTLAAHSYGTSVKQRAVPAAVEQALLSPQCVASHRTLTAHVRAIDKGWKAVGAFAAAMARFGRFDSATWTDPTGKSTAAYAAVLANRTRLGADGVGGLLAWAQYVGARDEASKAGLEAFVAKMESGALPPAKLDDAFVYRFYASVAQAEFERSAVLRRFSGRRHASVREEYAGLDRDIIKLRGRQVGLECRSRSNPPNGETGVRVDDKTEMELLNHLMPQQRPRVPVRQMLRRAGRAIQELKPCFMMGPQAVAQFLAPGQMHFDIVVMDEASQLRPEEAIGAIARGAQLVVVGDPKQLPPTSFFTRMAPADGDDEGLGQMATSEAESILDVCIGHFQPIRTLRWHYRSRHESLIAFSNHHFYRGNLVVFPSPYPKSKLLGLRYQYIADGEYEGQMNQVEARRVVAAAVEHILHRADDTLGIVTLNIKQRDLVAELLEERLRVLPEAVTFKQRWESDGKGLFIKNLENVQGDERDCIIISTTFGRPRGVDVVRQNFGPISRVGGWRRLNVLFTRARKSVAVFSSMRPEDIVVDASTPEGTRALRNYLEYARTGTLPVEQETNLPPDSEFEIAVMDMLRGKNYEVVGQLGVAGFRIDIGVRHPTHRSGYLAAIECDGASYHSGVSVRDRDRIRQEILEGLGWKGRIWRIWSTDWFRDPLAETQRLLHFLETLSHQPVPDEYALAVEAPPVAAHLPAGQPAVEAATQPAQKMVFEDDEEDLEIDIGDLVSYAPVDTPAKTVQVRLTARQTDLSTGLVAEGTPLGSILIGATVGETVVLRVPGKAPQSFVIQGVRRMPAEATQ